MATETTKTTESITNALRVCMIFTSVLRPSPRDFILPLLSELRIFPPKCESNLHKHKLFRAPGRSEFKEPLLFPLLHAYRGTGTVELGVRFSNISCAISGHR